MSNSYDPYEKINTKLDEALSGNETLAGLVVAYSDAVKYRHKDDTDKFGTALDTALKEAGFEYLERIEAKRMLQEEAAAAREDGKQATLRKQVAERYEGR